MNRNPRHLPRLIPFQKFGSAIWFVTFGTCDRKPVLADDTIHQAFRDF
jgi:hypothetical protein